MKRSFSASARVLGNLAGSFASGHSHWRAAILLALAGGFALPVAQAQEPPERMPRLLPPHIILTPAPEPRKPIEIAEMDVQARIVGLHAEVTTTLTFLNPNQRPLEGQLEFPLPDGATVTGYALDINGQMVDGVVVKKEKARVAFETEVRRGVDPGMVEQVAGNVFRTRVYPLPANGVRRVRLRSVTELPVGAAGDAAWSLPMPLGETIGKLGIRVEVVQASVTPTMGGFGNLRFSKMEDVWVAKTELRDAKPGEDIWVALPKLPAQVVAIERTEDDDTYFSLSDLLPMEQTKSAAPLPAPARLGIAWDASGSRDGKKAWSREIATLEKVLAKWPDAAITLVVFRDRPEEARDFGHDRAALWNAINELICDGGTDLAVVPEAMNAAKDIDGWLLFTDGLDTLSGRLPDFGKLRVTAVVSQTVAERELLRQVCGGAGGQVVDLQNLEPDAAAAAITSPPVRIKGVIGSGVAEVQGVGQVVHGRARLCGRLTGNEAELTLEYSDGHRSAPCRIEKNKATAGTLLASVWAGQRIRQLAVRAEANEDELLSLGRSYGIVSPVTSLIVLETLDQYLRNDIEPPPTLPELRQQWSARKASERKTKEKEQAGKLERVVAMWQARVAWWEKGYDVKPDFKWNGGPHGGDGEELPSPGEGRVFGRMPDAARPAATPAAPAREAAMGGVGHGFGSGGGMASGASAAQSERKNARDEGEGGPSIAIKPWNPETPYLRALRKADPADRYSTYLKFRDDNLTSPAFFLDCADFFFREGDRPLAVRILSNLAEMKIEEASLLRVMAWRFQQAEEFDRAIVLLRKVGKLRPEEPQSLRDLALALAERGKAKHSPADLSEAMALLEKMTLSEWQRFPEIEVVALEELNALIAWVHTQPWDKSPIIPKLDPRLCKNLDVDVRIVMSWDADATDVDLHVMEPSGEEAFYSHNRTHTGGLVSRDFTQGYGPEEYLVRHAQPGDFGVFAHYYGSSQQMVIGPATVTATVFTDFGRPTEKKQVLTLRLDKPRDKVEIGTVRFQRGKETEPSDGKKETPPGASDFHALKAGQTQDETRRLLGEPAGKSGDDWNYNVGDRRYRVRFSKEGKVLSVVETLPGGAEMILVQ